MSSELGACPSCWCLSGYIKEAAEHPRTGETHCRGCKKRRKALVRPAASLLEGSYLSGKHVPAWLQGVPQASSGPLLLLPTPRCTNAPGSYLLTHHLCPKCSSCVSTQSNPTTLQGPAHVPPSRKLSHPPAPTHTHTYPGPTYPGDPISTVPRAQDALRVHEKVYYLLKSE